VEFVEKIYNLQSIYNHIILDYMADSKINHDYHLVNPSPWPILASFSLLFVTVGAVLFMHAVKYGMFVLLLGFLMIIYTASVWWRDVIKEGKVDEAHTQIVRKGLSIGMLFFIISELVFFAAFFGSFFYSSIDPLAPLAEGSIWNIGKGIWPPQGIKTIDPWNIPFLNTLILLLSGTTVTWAHYALLENNHKDLIRGLAYTILLGCCFTALQVYEYVHAEFQWKDGIYSSNFYLTTGFHGLHVIIGTLFLSVCLFRARRGDFAKGNGHLGFEFAAWYWHFVDAIWLYLFIFLYVWGS
jgi:cytochrome c oxidase subunit 3